MMIYPKLIIDGNAVYEIDEACLEQRQKRLEELDKKKKGEHRQSKGNIH